MRPKWSQHLSTKSSRLLQAQKMQKLGSALPLQQRKSRPKHSQVPISSGFQPQTLTSIQLNSYTADTHYIPLLCPTPHHHPLLPKLLSLPNCKDRLFKSGSSGVWSGNLGLIFINGNLYNVFGYFQLHNENKTLHITIKFEYKNHQEFLIRSDC